MSEKRTPEEIRISIAAGRVELGSSLVRLRGEVTALTDWRSQLRQNTRTVHITATAVGFVVAGGVGALGAALFGRGRR